MAQIAAFGNKIAYQQRVIKTINFVGRLNNGLFINGEGNASSNGFKIIRTVSGIAGTLLAIDVADPLTISAWAHPQYTNANDNFIPLVSSSTDNGTGTGLGYCLALEWVTSTTFRLNFFLDSRNNAGGNICFISSTEVFTFGRTYHFAAVKGASSSNAAWSVYLNGSLLSATRSANSPAGSLLSNGYIKVGTVYDSEILGGLSGYRFKGYLLRLKMLNRAITAAEVKYPRST
jgi:hypothetical protein